MGTTNDAGLDVLPSLPIHNVTHQWITDVVFNSQIAHGGTPFCVFGAKLQYARISEFGVPL